MIPHITDEIKSMILDVDERIDIVIVEIGGTVGDIESLPFLEAIRQLRNDLGKENTLFVHLTLVPFIKTAGEMKTKPTQHSVKELREIGIQPDILLCRTEEFLPTALKDKIALFCNVEKDAVITAKDVETIYAVPLMFNREGLDDKITAAPQHLGQEARPRRVAEHRRCRHRAEEAGRDRHGRQVREADRFVQEPQRGADPRRHRQQLQGRSSATSTRRTWRRT